MKNGKVLWSLLVIFSSPAFAVTHVEHAYSHVLNGIPLSNACVTESEVKTINSVKVCIEKRAVEVVLGQDNHTDFICTKWSSNGLGYPRKYKATKCAAYKDPYDGNVECAKTKVVYKLLPKTITVRTWTENRDYNNYPGVFSQFTFPNCK